MLLKAVLLALSMLASGIGTLQAAAVMQSYALLGLGLALATFGVLRMTHAPTESLAVE